MVEAAIKRRLQNFFLNNGQPPLEFRLENTEENRIVESQVKSNPDNNRPKKPSATERLTYLENAAQSLFQLSNDIIKDLMDVKKTLQLLNNKVDALAKASIAGEEPNDEVLNRIMIENNVADLTKKVSNLVEQGMLVVEEVTLITPLLLAANLMVTIKFLILVSNSQLRP